MQLLLSKERKKEHVSLFQYAAKAADVNMRYVWMRMCFLFTKNVSNHLLLSLTLLHLHAFNPPTMNRSILLRPVFPLPLHLSPLFHSHALLLYNKVEFIVVVDDE